MTRAQFLERTQPHLVSGATGRAAAIIGQLLDTSEHHGWSYTRPSGENMQRAVDLLPADE